MTQFITLQYVSITTYNSQFPTVSRNKGKVRITMVLMDNILITTYASVTKDTTPGNST